MIECWPTIKRIALCSISSLDFAVSLSEEIKECERKFAHVWEKPEEKKMNKEEARKAAKKLQKDVDVWTTIEEHDDLILVRVKPSNGVLKRIDFTPEPPPIKKGVLCVGETCSSKKIVFGRSAGNMDRDGDLMLETSDFTVGSYEERTLPVRNARPVTPSDLVRWGWEKPKECADCKHDAYGYDPHGDEPCASCCKSSKNRPNFEPIQ